MRQPPVGWLASGVSGSSERRGTSNQSPSRGERTNFSSSRISRFDADTEAEQDYIQVITQTMNNNQSNGYMILTEALSGADETVPGAAATLTVADWAAGAVRGVLVSAAQRWAQDPLTRHLAVGAAADLTALVRGLPLGALVVYLICGRRTEC